MIPQANPCGLVCEMVRSCYASYWRFYRGSPDVRTKGYFYFVPKDTPCVPFPHPWTTPDWTTDSPVPDDVVGPIRGAARAWRNGSIGVFPPAGGVVGTPAQIAGDATFPADAFRGDVIDGLPITCWVNFNLPFLPVDVVFNLTECCLQRAYARVIDRLYANDYATITAFFIAWLGPAVNIVPMPLDGLFPATVLVVTSAYALVFVSGTANFQQIALQGASGLLPPIPQGGMSTQPLWWETSNRILDKLDAQAVGVNTPLFFCGHSYGAAVAAILAARAQQGFPGRRIQALTFAMPKPGDIRMVRLIQAATCLHVWNQGDAVPLLPPGPAEMQGVFAGLTDAIRSIWLVWRTVPSFLQLAPDGTRTVGSINTVDLERLDDYIQDLIAFIPLNPLTAHSLAEYMRRMALSCPCPDAVIPADPWRVLFPADEIGMGGLRVGAVEPVQEDFAPDGGMKIGTTAPEWFSPAKVGGVKIGTAGVSARPLTYSEGFRVGSQH